MMEVLIQIPYFIFMRYRIFILILLFGSPNIIKAQSLVYGGFASFSITDTTFYASNAGGGIAYTDTITNCLMVYGGNVFGKGELFQKHGIFNDKCFEIKEKFFEIKIYPNPSNGIYWIEGKEIVLIVVFDHLGRKVISKNYLPNALLSDSIDITDVAVGNYYIQVQNTNGQSKVYSLIKINS